MLFYKNEENIPDLFAWRAKLDVKPLSEEIQAYLEDIELTVFEAYYDSFFTFITFSIKEPLPIERARKIRMKIIKHFGVLWNHQWFDEQEEEQIIQCCKYNLNGSRFRNCIEGSAKEIYRFFEKNEFTPDRSISIEDRLVYYEFFEHPQIFTIILNCYSFIVRDSENIKNILLEHYAKIMEPSAQGVIIK